MKKLMFAAALAAVGSAFAIESANIVGYQSAPGVDGFKCIVPTFKNIDGSDVSMQDFKPVGDDVGYGSEFLMTYDENMGVSPLYTYYLEDSGAAPEGDGWYDEDGIKADVTFPSGNGCVYQSAGAPLQYSGSVAKGPIPIVELYDGFTCIGNASPVQKSMQDFKPIGDSVGYGSEFLMTYDENMAVSPLYTYYLEDSGAAPEGDGWYDEDGIKADVTFEPGDGFVIQCAGDCTLEITKVID